MPKRKNVLFLLKFLFGIAVLVFFFLQTKTSIKGIGLKLKGVSGGWLAVAFSLQALGLLISVLRWQILARAQGDEVPLPFLAKSYLVAMFFNNFLPTRFGGDVVRIWDGSKYSKSLVKSSAVVLVDRLTGVIVLFIFALAASLFRLDMARQVPVIWAALALGLAGLAAVVFFFLPVFGRLLEKIPEKAVLRDVKQKIIAFRTAILFYGKKRREFGRATAWAVLLQLNVILYYFLIGRGLHLSIPLLDYFIFIPLVLLIQIIPVTINGLGITQMAYVEIFRFYGISAETAFSFSIIDIVFGLIIGLIGGAIYLSRK